MQRLEMNAEEPPRVPSGTVDIVDNRQASLLSRPSTSNSSISGGVVGSGVKIYTGPGGGLVLPASLLKPTKHPFKYTCPFCSKRYTSRSGLLSHKNTVHFQRKPYRCQVCNEHFYTSASRVGHIRKDHPDESLSLIRTTQEAMGEDGYEESDSVMIVDPLATEEIPDKNSSAGVTGEDSIVVDARDAVDDGCQQKDLYHGKDSNVKKKKRSRKLDFDGNTNESQYVALLHNHGEQELKDKGELRDKFVCMECNLSFAGSDRLLLHLEKHVLPRNEELVTMPSESQEEEESETSFSCDHCSKTFTHESWRKIHVKYHHPGDVVGSNNNIASYKCEFCYESFQDPDHKRLHATLSCPHAKLTCCKCPAVFQSVVAYAKHLKESHKADNDDGASGFKCPLCPASNLESAFDKRFLDHFDASHHDQLVSFRCNLCDFKSENAKTCLDHLGSHPEAVGKKINLSV